MLTKLQKKELLKHIIGIVGGIPQISRYADKKEDTTVHIVKLEDIPEEGVNLYTTIGTSDHSIGLKVNDLPLRVEFLFACDARVNMVENMLATCSFNIINTNYKCYPGVIYNNVISLYLDDTEMKHILFVRPFLWDEYKFKRFDDEIVEWLLAVPISESEALYADKNGISQLEDIFCDRQIDIYDIYRKSVI